MGREGGYDGSTNATLPDPKRHNKKENNHVSVASTYIISCNVVIIFEEEQGPSLMGTNSQQNHTHHFVSVRVPSRRPFLIFLLFRLPILFEPRQL